MRLVTLVLACLLLKSAILLAQGSDDLLPSRSILPQDLRLDIPAPPLPDPQPWIKEYKAWQKWAAEWLDRPQWVLYPFPYPFWKDEPDLFSYKSPRRIEPLPPDWLESACVESEGLLAADDLLAEACKLFSDWKDGYVVQRIRRQMSATSIQNERTVKTVLYEHLHVAGLGTNMQAQPSPRAYGLAGLHMTIDIHGRWQMYAFPGVLAVRVPNWDGKQIITIGYDWGFAIRLFDFEIPYFKIPGRAHVNIIKVWMPEIQTQVDMIGLSITPRRKTK
ncbi:MAG: hypothetical protein WDN47_03465 [Candidatus Doudnabacteria bacterium]